MDHRPEHPRQRRERLLDLTDSSEGQAMFGDTAVGNSGPTRRAARRKMRVYADELRRSERKSSINGSIPTALPRVQVGLNEKAPTCGVFAEPSDGLEPSTPSSPWNVSSNRSQPVATDFACFRGLRARRFATNCHRLQPPGSIKVHPRLCAAGLARCRGGDARCRDAGAAAAFPADSLSQPTWRRDLLRTGPS
jgi:hypothetical protein